MKKKMIKGVVSAALVVSMAAGTLGCGSKKAKETDPALAKEGVFSYENIDLGLGGESNYEVMSSSACNGDAVIAVKIYDYESEEYSESVKCYTVGEKGKIKKTVELEQPDCSEFDVEMSVESGLIDGAVGDLSTDGTITQAYPDIVVLTDGEDTNIETEEDIATDDVFQEYDPYFGVDDDYYYDDGYYEGGTYESLTINSIYASNDGGFVGLANYYVSGYDDNGNYLYGDYNILCGWDSEGKIEWTNNLNETTGWSWVYISGSTMLDNGQFITVISGDETAVYIFDNKGGVVNKKNAAEIKELSSVRTLMTTKDGRILIMYYDEDNEYELTAAYMDPNTLAVKEKINIPDEINAIGFSSLMPGIDSDFVVSTSIGLAKFNAGDTNVKYFMNYINSDMDSYGLENFVMVDEHHFIGIYYDADYMYQAAYFSYVDPADIPDKKIINMAVYYLNYNMRSAVVDFNKHSDEYRIIVTNYSQYATDDDWTSGYTRMNNDIISGNAPDIIIAQSEYVNYNAYADKGMLVDFDSLLAKDDELKDETYLTNVFDAYAIKGKHYLGIYSFEYATFIGSERVFGNKSSWTISDFKNMQNDFPAGSQLLPYINQEAFLATVIRYDGSEFVDAETGKCDFDSDDFISLLEYAASLPAETAYEEDEYFGDYAEKYRNGKILLAEEYLYNPKWYQQERYEYYGGNVASIGFPSRTGDSAVITSNSTPIAIFKGSNVDGAWEFTRQFFTEKYQDSLEYEIPVLESSFDKWAAKGMERDFYENEDGTIEYWDNYYYIDDVSYVVPVMTKDDVEDMKAMIKACSKSSYFNDNITEIIEEEASACFAGQKSAREVATIIQSRVQLYINENK